MSEEIRECRCMFCGVLLTLKSEQEAMDHMTVCPALNEQLNSPDQFTLPTEVKEKMKMAKEQEELREKEKIRLQREHQI